MKKPVNEILVTVRVLTYNHAEYIKDALDGIMMQKTSFPFECSIYDDASTDGTSEIIRQYERKYPGKIKAHIAKENTYGKPNSKEIKNQIEEENIIGKYVAICEGDDYWIDDKKLQTQISFMESHPDVVFTVHSSIWKDYSNNTECTHVLYDSDQYISMKDLLTIKDVAPSTASIIVRRDVYFQYRKDDSYPQTWISDFPEMLYYLNIGKCYCFSRPMSVYRYKTPNSWTERTNGKKYALFSMNYLKFFYEYDKYTNYKYTDYIRVFSNQQLLTTICMLCDENDEVTCKDIIQDISQSHSEYEKYIKALTKAYDIIIGNRGLSTEEVSILKQKKHVFLFGCGRYSAIVERILSREQISIEGYLTSKKNFDSFNGKPVFAINDIPYDLEEFVIVVGVSYIWKLELLPSIKPYKYIAPLWKDLCNWL